MKSIYIIIICCLGIIICIGDLKRIDMHEINTRENARLKTFLQWICNDSPTHEDCEGLQREER